MNIKKLLFENLGIRQTIFKNTFWLMAAEFVSRVLKLGLLIFAARILGATQYGKFTFALSFVAVIVIFADLGLSDITTRELSRDKEAEKEYPAIIALKIILSIVALTLMVIGSFFITADPAIQRIIWVLAAFMILSSFLGIIYAFLRARQRMEYESAVKILQILLIAGIGLFVLLFLPSSKNLAYAYLFANLITLALVLFFFHFRFYPLKLSLDTYIWKRFLDIAWPLSLGFVMGWIYVSIDSIMLGHSGRVIETGWYNAAYKIAAAAVLSATLISRSFFPVLSKLFKESKKKLQRAWNYQAAAMIAISLPVMAGGWVLAPKIIDFFYGRTYSPSVFAFQLLILVAGIGFLYYPFAIALVISDQQRKNFWLILTGAVINIILNLILIPRYNLYGAGIATIISSVATLWLAVKFSREFTPISPLNKNLAKILAIAAFASTIMLMGLRQPIIYNLNVFLSILIGILIYCFVLIFFYKFLFKRPLVETKKWKQF